MRGERRTGCCGLEPLGPRCASDGQEWTIERSDQCSTSLREDFHDVQAKRLRDSYDTAATAAAAAVAVLFEGGGSSGGGKVVQYYS